MFNFIMIFESKILMSVTIDDQIDSKRNFIVNLLHEREDCKFIELKHTPI